MKKYLLLLVFTLASLPVFGQPPRIVSILPAMGPVGSTVTISGRNFNSAPANNIVFLAEPVQRLQLRPPRH